MKRKKLFLIGILSLFLIVAFGSETKAFKLACDRIEIKGYLRNQQVFRIDNLQRDFEHIQNRTTLRLEMLANVADRIGYLRNVTFFGTLEPFYDAAFDMYSDNKTWGGVMFPNYRPDKQTGFLTRPGAGLHHGDRDDYSWKGYHNTWAWFKEYLVAFDIGRLNLRLGKQIVTWGRSDLFRLADVINPQDFSWHFIFEGVEETRIPLHIMQGIYDIGDVGPLADVAFEFVFNPGDFTGDYLGYEGLPWNVIPEPGMHHWQRQNRHYGKDNFEWGFRFEATTGHVNFTLNYFNAPVDSFVLNLRDMFLNLFATGVVDESLILREYPRAQWIGFTAEYDESRFTKSILRTEFLFIKGRPHTIDAINALGIRDAANVKPGDFNNYAAEVFAPGGNLDSTLDRDVIRYVIGWDRPTWIRLLNPMQSFFLTAQLFGTHILNRDGIRIMDGPYPVQSTEFVASFVGWTDYVNGRLRPFWGFAYDFTSNAGLALLSLQYIHGNHWIYKVGSNLIWGRERNLVRDTSSLGGLICSARHNDELYFNIQYQF
ncbi:MAG: DUF1302 family protein [Pseudomonadota bacterium]